jgi:hypothetical protein
MIYALLVYCAYIPKRNGVHPSGRSNPRTLYTFSFTKSRPDYLKIARFATEHPNIQRVLCLTATAIPSVAEDICREFLIKPEGVFRTPVFRPK